MTRPAVILVGFLDTKAVEHAFVQTKLTDAGNDVIVVDVSIQSDVKYPFNVNHNPRSVAQSGGDSIDRIRELPRHGALQVMTRSAVELVKGYERENKVHGVVGLGGSTTTALVCEVMRALKIGLPKLVVSTMASGDVSPYVGDSDICIMPSIVDISGTLNAISTRILANAAAAVAGMAQQYFQTSSLIANKEQKSTKRNVAVTMFGLTTPGVTAACHMLRDIRDPSSQEPLYEPIVFHATGIGGRCMERLVDEGYFDAVLDLTTTELADEQCGGVLSAGPNRLTAASKAGIPQVVSLGALDMCNFGPRASIPEKYTQRKLHEHNSSVTLMRTSEAECAAIGSAMADRLRQAPHTTVLVIPKTGWSGIDIKGGSFFDPVADSALVAALKAGLEGSGIPVLDVDAHVNDEAFARIIVDKLHQLASQKNIK